MLRQRGSKDKTSSATKTPAATQPTPSSKTGPISKSGHAAAMDDPRQPLLGSRDGAALSQRPLTPPSQDHSAQDPQEERTQNDQVKEMENLSRKSQWIVLALASGACAAFNGVFAKLYVIPFLCFRSSDGARSGERRRYTSSLCILMDGLKGGWDPFFQMTSSPYAWCGYLKGRKVTFLPFPVG
jgi:hypothetical protein